MTSISQDDIFGPFFAMQLLTIAVWVFMYSKRIPFLIGYLQKHEGEMKQKELGDPSSKHYINNITPDAVRNPSDNLKNLFEVPILFYGMVFYLHSTQTVDLGYLIAAWMFVLFRYIHSFIHCTFNNINVRFFIYVISCAVLFYMVIRASINHFLSSSNIPS